MKVTMQELNRLTTDELNNKVKSFKSELLTLRQQKTLGTLKGNEIKQMRKNVARVLTALSERRLKEAIETHRDAKKLPKELRMKMTKSMRLKLSEKQKRKQVWKVRCAERKYPKRYFAYVEDQ